MWLYWGVTANSVPLNVAVTFQDTWQKPTNITQTIIKIPLKAVLYHVNDTSSKRSSGWHFCFQGRFNGCRPLMAFQQCFSLQTRRPCHIPLIRVKGWHLSHPWILTAGTLSDSERRPLFPEAVDIQWRACVRAHQVCQAVNHVRLSRTRSRWIKRKQYI